MLNNTFTYAESIGQIIGFVAMISALGVYGYKSRKKILFAKLIADFLWSVHFFLIGASAGCALNVANTIRDGIFFNKDTKKWASYQGWMIIFFVLNIISGIASRQGVISLLPIVGSSVSIIGLWCSEAKKLRIASLFAVSLWLIYAGLSHSWVSFAYNAFAVCSIVTGMIRERNPK